MQAKDVMTRLPICVTPRTKAQQAVSLMLRHRVSGLPVVDETGRVVGMVTEGDFLRRAEIGTDRKRARWLEYLLSPGRLAAEYARSHATFVDEVMTPDVVTVAPEAPLAEAVEKMESHRVKRIPVVSGEKLVGLISRADLLRALVAETAGAPAAASTTDAAIRERILAEIAVQPWGPRASVDAIVHDGVVELRGTIFDERERTALRVLAETVPGVTSVSDQLVWIEPISGMVVEASEAKRTTA